MVISSVLRTAGSSIIWNYADPLTSLELLNFYLTLSINGRRFCILGMSFNVSNDTILFKTRRLVVAWANTRRRRLPRPAASPWPWWPSPPPRPSPPGIQFQPHLPGRKKCAIDLFFKLTVLLSVRRCFYIISEKKMFGEVISWNSISGPCRISGQGKFDIRFIPCYFRNLLPTGLPPAPTGLPPPPPKIPRHNSHENISIQVIIKCTIHTPVRISWYLVLRNLWWNLL